MSKLFSTHPPTDDRISKSQKEIADLKPKPEYVVTTSEFNDVKSRLAMLENQRRPDKTSDDPNKPTLRRNPNSTAPIEDETDPSKKNKGDDSDRPKLKRRPSDTGDNPSTAVLPITSVPGDIRARCVHEAAGDRSRLDVNCPCYSARLGRQNDGKTGDRFRLLP